MFNAFTPSCSTLLSSTVLMYAPLGQPTVLHALHLVKDLLKSRASPLRGKQHGDAHTALQVITLLHQTFPSPLDPASRRV